MTCVRAERLRRGFTLVELLVVIGIIALLIGVLLPVLGKARESANRLKCAATMRQWGIALQNYVASNQGVVPIGGEPLFGKYTNSDFSYGTNADGNQANRPLGRWSDPSFWFNGLPPLVGKKSYDAMQQDHLAGGARLPREGENTMFTCPTAGQASDGLLTGDGYHEMYGHSDAVPLLRPNPANPRGIYNAAPVASDATRPAYFSYVWNSKLCQTKPRMKASSLRPSSTLVVMIEKRMNAGEVPQNVTDAYQLATGRGPVVGIGNGRLGSRDLNRIKGDWQRFTARHSGGGNLLFGDGHVAFFNYLELVKPSKGAGSPVTADFNQPNRVIWDPFGLAGES